MGLGRIQPKTTLHLVANGRGAVQWDVADADGLDAFCRKGAGKVANRMASKAGGIVTQHKQVQGVTGHPGVKSFIQGLAGPGVSFLTKPVEPKEVAAILRTVESPEDEAPADPKHYGLLIGFPLLTIGLLAGSIWAGEVWGTHWQWDPKLMWVLVFWFCYAFVLHQRLAIGWRGRRAARWSLAVFVLLFVLLMAGLSLFGTIHRFV